VTLGRGAVEHGGTREFQKGESEGTDWGDQSDSNETYTDDMTRLSRHTRVFQEKREADRRRRYDMDEMEAEVKRLKQQWMEPNNRTSNLCARIRETEARLLQLQEETEADM
jgi:hypothetical protein